MIEIGLGDTAMIYCVGSATDAEGGGHLYVPGMITVVPSMNRAGEIEMLEFACQEFICWLTLDARCSNGPFTSSIGIEMLAKATELKDLALENTAVTPLP
jgi:hypothetical protein